MGEPAIVRARSTMQAVTPPPHELSVFLLRLMCLLCKIALSSSVGFRQPDSWSISSEIGILIEPVMLPFSKLAGGLASVIYHSHISPSL